MTAAVKQRAMEPLTDVPVELRPQLHLQRCPPPASVNFTFRQASASPVTHTSFPSTTPLTPVQSARKHPRLPQPIKDFASQK